MKTKVLAFMVAAMFLSFSIAAQSYLGLRSGLTWSNYQQDYVLEDGLESNLNRGLAVSFFADLPLANGFSIQPELGYLEKGFRLTNENEDSYEQTWRYLEIPLLAKYRFFTGSDHFYLTAGPSLGFAFEGKREYNDWPINYDEEVGDIKISTEQEYNFRSDYIGGKKDNRWDFGLVLGTGATVKLGSGNLVLDARYGWDLTDNQRFEADAPADYEGAYNRNFTLSIGYAFPIGR